MGAALVVPPEASSIFGNITLLAVSAHLMSKSLAFVKYKKKNNFINQITVQKVYQREQGLIIFNLMMVHVILGFRKMLPTFDINNLEGANLSGLLPTLIMTSLLLTSYKPFQKMFKKWKKLHSIIWVMIPLVVVHAYISTGHLSLAMLISVVMLGISLIASASYNKKVLNRRIVFLGIGTLLSLLTNYLVKAYQDQKQQEANDKITANAKSKQPVNTQPTTQTPTENTPAESTPVASVNKIYKDGTYSGQAAGYRGETIEVSVTVKEDKITDVTLVQSDDRGSRYIASLQSTMIEQQTTQIPNISGATFSSTGIKNATQNALNQAKI
jgi:uncharacterized protein with FMN-binding domain